MIRRKVVIMGAAGRDFHNFNCLFREDESREVVAFTATQIPDIADRSYPPALAGSLSRSPTSSRRSSPDRSRRP